MTHIQQRRGTAAQWAAANPVLFDGEIGWESDTRRGKMGDGSTQWSALPYLNGVSSVAGKTGVVTLDLEDIEGAAPLFSPNFTGTPTAPTPTTASNATRVATTAFVKNLNYAPLASPAFTGTPTAPTQSASNESTRIATTAFVKAALLAMWPVGSIFTHTVNTNPSLFIGGSWTAHGAGRVLVGVDPAQAEFDTVGETGGSKTHTLTVPEMPPHTHQQTFGGPLTTTNAIAGAAVVGQSNSMNTGSAGGMGGTTQPHNNLQPYITVYFWRRTA